MFASALFALATTLALAPVVLGLLRRVGIVDVPNDRSSHVRPTPRGGGLAPALAVVAAVLVSPDLVGEPRAAVLVAACGFGLLGLVDDFRGLPALNRLGLQFVVGTAALPWLLSDLTGPAAWRAAFIVGVVVWIPAYVNAFNFMDGIDGMAVTQTLVAGLAWWLVGWGANVPALESGGMIVAAAALAFAPFNFPKARMFLGDVGSYFFGGALAAIAVVGLRAGVAPEAVLAPLTLYLADTGSTLLIRVRRGEAWYRAHRDHVYQRLVRAGWSHATTSMVAGVLMAISGLLGAVSLSGSPPARVVADVLLLAVMLGYLRLPAKVAVKGELVRSPAPDPVVDREGGTHEARV